MKTGISLSLAILLTALIGFAAHAQTGYPKAKDLYVNDFARLWSSFQYFRLQPFIPNLVTITPNPVCSAPTISVAGHLPPPVSIAAVHLSTVAVPQAVLLAAGVRPATGRAEVGNSRRGQPLHKPPILNR